MMQHESTKADRKLVRKLASIAWERQLRDELAKIGGVISEMTSGDLSPFDVNECVHEFHNGISRELYNLYAASDPWFAVCRAHFDGVLTDEDLVNASDSVRAGLQQFAERLQEYNGIQTAPRAWNDG
ncbi:hypothetical protein Q31b_58220 [Novipirellula aureliae]|uniref:Uncharacterized protein n=1 Tax=Novipirellula aureliae TaxID=2527966 RepID=A0A5C6DA23_9BACT|nr:hypothetical protein [Novipirellula aureliae]TWU32664.1 hypothetical protein Q31b_58220 [Novipirellula aureliae]